MMIFWLKRAGAISTLALLANVFPTVWPDAERAKSRR
jgi:hypothetical protein